MAEAGAGVVDGVFAHAVVVDAHADVAAEVGTGAEHPRHGEAGVIGIVVDAVVLRSGFAFGGNPQHVSAHAEFGIGGDVVPQLVVEVADTGHEGDVEVGGGGEVLVEVFVVPRAADGVPKHIDLDEGSDLADSDVEAVAGAIAEAEADGGVFAHFFIGEGDGGVVAGDVLAEVAGGQVGVEEDRLAELCLGAVGDAESEDGKAHKFYDLLHNVLMFCLFISWFSWERLSWERQRSWVQFSEPLWVQPWEQSWEQSWEC